MPFHFHLVVVYATTIARHEFGRPAVPSSQPGLEKGQLAFLLTNLLFYKPRLHHYIFWGI